jgi:hypothetical protein
MRYSKPSACATRIVSLQKILLRLIPLKVSGYVRLMAELQTWLRSISSFGWGSR